METKYMITPENKYHKRIEAYQRLLEKQVAAVNRISNMRLLVFIDGTAASVVSYFMQLNYVLSALIGGTIGLFIYFVIKHSHLNDNRKLTGFLLDINKKSLARATDQWHTFEDKGNEFIDAGHDYSLDLDIFGEGSLFQKINCALTYKGRLKLKELLCFPKKTVKEIKERQQAINELSGLLRWRQHFMSEAMMIAHKFIDPQPLFEWTSNKKGNFVFPGWIRFIRWLPLITLPSLVLLFTTSVIPWYIPIGLVLLQFILLGWKAAEFGAVFAIASKYKDVIKTYYRLILSFEKKFFRSPCLNVLKARLTNNKGFTACRQINRLIKIIDTVNNRANGFFFIINLLTLWDYQFILILENWKKASGASLENWFDAIGEVEALCSLAVLRHDNPAWAVPEFVNGNPFYAAKDLGHPLLGKNRVANSLELGYKKQILLITGSNMSGKSTFLRTAGINLVLAYAGAPVCAASFQCSLMKIQTCMRITDNLEHNTSSFYAELLRIKEIVRTSESGEPLFFLLDEIFKGTNSIDRHAGAEAVINKLSNTTTLGLVSTHDLELGAIEQKNSRVGNFHFREFYKDNRIYFDYKLRTGVSETRNAAYLMKMAGIDI